MENLQTKDEERSEYERSMNGDKELRAQEFKSATTFLVIQGGMMAFELVKNQHQASPFSTGVGLNTTLVDVAEEPPKSLSQQKISEDIDNSDAPQNAPQTSQQNIVATALAPAPTNNASPQNSTTKLNTADK